MSQEQMGPGLAKYARKLPKGWADALGYSGDYALIGVWLDDEYPRLVVSDPDVRVYGGHNPRALQLLAQDEDFLDWLATFGGSIGGVAHPATHPSHRRF
jgi:hypothetical protein